MNPGAIKPKVGMGATYLCGSDCYPYTIVTVSKNGGKIQLQGDIYKRTDKNGFSESQEYAYFS